MSGRLFCFGHRGASGTEPENTLRAVRKALELGADGIEIDVRLADGHLMVIHDRKLDRTTDGRGYIERRTFSGLRELDAGKGEKIPTLDEVFHTTGRRAIVNVELKGPHTSRPVAELIAARVAAGKQDFTHFLVSSFDRGRLRELRHVCPEIPIGVLLRRVPRSLAAGAARLGAASVHVALDKVTPALVADARRRGLKVHIFTVNEPDDIQRMRALGVDGVFSDFPERVVG